MATKNPPKVTKRAIQIFPERAWLKKRKAKLPRRFPPHRLKGIEPGSIDERTVGELRELMDKQLDSLLGALGLARTMPNAWERAFFNLAVIHYGAGHITWTPPRGPNRRAQKRSIALDRELKSDVQSLTAKGYTETQALEKISKDPEKCVKFRLRTDARSETPDWKRHFQTLKKRWTQVQKLTSFELALGEAFAITDVASWLAARKEVPELQSGKIQVTKKSSR